MPTICKKTFKVTFGKALKLMSAVDHVTSNESSATNSATVPTKAVSDSGSNCSSSAESSSAESSSDDGSSDDGSSSDEDNSISKKDLALLLLNDEDAEQAQINKAMRQFRELLSNNDTRDVTIIFQLLFYVRGKDIKLKCGKRVTFRTNEDHTHDPLYFLQLPDSTILNDDDNEGLQDKLFVPVHVHTDSSNGIPRNMHGQKDGEFYEDFENCVSLPTEYLSELVTNDAMKIDGKVVSTVKQVERLVGSRFKQDAADCIERVENLFDFLKSVVSKGSGKKRAAEGSRTSDSKKHKSDTNGKKRKKRKKKHKSNKKAKNSK